jgi:hypothetical protein
MKEVIRVDHNTDPGLGYFEEFSFNNCKVNIRMKGNSSRSQWNL